MIILGVILLIIGFIASIPILWTIGIILVVIGVVLALAGMAGHAIGGRSNLIGVDGVELLLFAENLQVPQNQRPAADDDGGGALLDR